MSFHCYRKRLWPVLLKRSVTEEQSRKVEGGGVTQRGGDDPETSSWFAEGAF